MARCGSQYSSNRRTADRGNGEDTLDLFNHEVERDQQLAWLIPGLGAVERAGQPQHLISGLGLVSSLTWKETEPEELVRDELSRDEEHPTNGDTIYDSLPVYDEYGDEQWYSWVSGGNRKLPGDDAGTIIFDESEREDVEDYMADESGKFSSHSIGSFVCEYIHDIVANKVAAAIVDKTFVIKSAIVGGVVLDSSNNTECGVSLENPLMRQVIVDGLNTANNTENHNVKGNGDYVDISTENTEAIVINAIFKSARKMVSMQHTRGPLKENDGLEIEITKVSDSGSVAIPSPPFKKKTMIQVFQYTNVELNGTINFLHDCGAMKNLEDGALIMECLQTLHVELTTRGVWTLENYRVMHYTPISDGGLKKDWLKEPPVNNEPTNVTHFGPKTSTQQIQFGSILTDFKPSINLSTKTHTLWFNAPFDPGGIGLALGEMTHKAKLFRWVVMIIKSGNRVDVPFDPGGFDPKAKLEDEFFSKAGSMMQ